MYNIAVFFFFIAVASAMLVSVYRLPAPRIQACITLDDTQTMVIISFLFILFRKVTLQFRVDSSLLFRKKNIIYTTNFLGSYQKKWLYQPTRFFKKKSDSYYILGLLVKAKENKVIRFQVLIKNIYIQDPPKYDQYIPLNH